MHQSGATPSAEGSLRQMLLPHHIVCTLAIKHHARLIYPDWAPPRTPTHCRCCPSHCCMLCSALLCCRASGNKFSHLSFQQFSLQYLRPKKGALSTTQTAGTAPPAASSSSTSSHAPPLATPTPSAGSGHGATSTSGSESGSGSGSGSDQAAAASVDWVAAGKVTPVRNQEHCSKAADG